jgi:hypothetical protein
MQTIISVIPIKMIRKFLMIFRILLIISDFVGLPFVSFINTRHQHPERAKYHNDRATPSLYRREAETDWNAGVPPPTGG